MFALYKDQEPLEFHGKFVRGTTMIKLVMQRRYTGPSKVKAEKIHWNRKPNPKPESMDKHPVLSKSPGLVMNLMISEPNYSYFYLSTICLSYDIKATNIEIVSGCRRVENGNITKVLK